MAASEVIQRQATGERRPLLETTAPRRCALMASGALPARKRPRDDSPVASGEVKDKQVEVDAVEVGHLQETTTSKGKTALVRAGYVYLLNKRTASGRTYWFCRQKSCSARLNRDEAGAVTKLTAHSHSAVPEEVHELRFKSILKEMAKDDKAPVKEIYENIRKRFAAVHGAESSLPSFKEVKASLYRAREVREDDEECHRSVDLTLRVSELSTHLGDPWLVADDDVECEDGLKRLLVFADNFMLQLLSRSVEWWIDGSFSSSPKHFRQLYTVFCSFEGDVFPVVYGLLPSTSADVYQCLFRTIRAKFACLGCPTRGPDLIHADFEEGALAAAAREFPSAQIVGRYYHLSHANYSQVQAFLGNRYLHDAKLRMQIRQLWALAMLPREEVEAAFEELAAEFPTGDAGVGNYLQYFSETWIQGQFPPDLWNMSCIKNRVNGPVEMWHRRLNCVLESTHTRFHRFLSRLKNEQHLARGNAGELHKGSAAKARNKRDAETELELNRAVSAYDRNLLSRAQFLKRCESTLRKCS